MRVEDQVLTWKKPLGNWETRFCDESLKVVHHIWVDSKAVWDEIGDSGKQHRQAYKDK